MQFGGAVLEGTGEVVRNAGSNLPIWAADQLGIGGDGSPQAGIDNPLDTSLGNVSGRQDLWDDVQVQEAPFFEGLTPQTVIAGGVVLVGAFFILKAL